MEKYNIPQLNLLEYNSMQDSAWADAVKAYEKENRGRKFRDLPEKEQQMYFAKALSRYGLTMNSKGYIIRASKMNKGTPMTESVKALAEHVKKQVPLCDSIFRYQSEAYFDTFRKAKQLREAGSLPELDWESEEMLATDIGESVVVKGVGRVWLDVPYLQEAESNMQNMFNDLRIDDNTHITDGNKELTLDEVGPGFYNLGYDRDGRCFEMSKTSKQNAKDNITGYGEYKVSDADITDFNGARYYYNDNMPDGGVLNITSSSGIKEAEEGMIGEPDSFYDAEQRQEAYNDLQDALAQSNSTEAEYVKDGSCPECPNVEDDEDCNGFGNYGCDDGILTYNGDDVSWKEIQDHDERQAQRQQAKANYPGDEEVIKQAAKMMPNMDDPRMIVQQLRADYPQLGRAKASDLAGKAKQIAFPESAEIDRIKNLAGLNELKDERSDIEKIEDLLKDAIGSDARGEDMYELYAELESMDSEKADEVKLIAKEIYGVRLEEGKSPHKKGTKKYKKHMAAMHAEDLEEKALKDVGGDDIVTVNMGGVDREFIRKGDEWESTDQVNYPMKFKVGTPTHKKLLNIQRKKQMARSTPSAQARRKLKVMASAEFSHLQQAYDKVYQLTDKMGDEALEQMNRYAPKFSDALEKHDDIESIEQNDSANVPDYIKELDYVLFQLGESINEAEYQGKKVQLNKPKRGGSKKYYVYVKSKKGNVKKISFGDPGLKTKSGNKARAKSFAARHNCEKKNDKTKAGYWACRLPRYGLVKGGKWW